MAKSSVAKRSEGTRLSLLRAAEKLFAARGVEAVSMREIAVAAGQSNNSAVLYHFEDKRDLVNSLLERHSDPIQAAWLATLDHISAEGRNDLEELVRIMVRPLVAKLDDPDGGADYLLIVADLVTSRSVPLMTLPAVSAPGILELSAKMMQHTGAVAPEVLQLRMMSVAALLYCSIANYHALTSMGMEIPRTALVDELVGAITAVIRAQGSAAEKLQT